ncbi:MAG: hypothetical protein Q4C49_08445 [Bacillota bacterium]|nr:hypothetical protein [Bacillota bacterium]
MDFSQYDKQKLIALLNELEKDAYCNKKINEYLFENQQLLNSYKEKLEIMFFPKAGMPISHLGYSDHLIEEYKTVSKDQSNEIDMYYLEILLEFIKTYGMMSTSFYERMVELFKNLCQSKSGSLFQPRLSLVCDTMGYISPTHQKSMADLLKNLELYK